MLELDDYNSNILYILLLIIICSIIFKSKYLGWYKSKMIR